MSDASKPDGTDPRILQPEGETVWTASATKQSGTRRYHASKECKRLQSANATPVERDLSYANWKGLGACEACHGGVENNRLDVTRDGEAIDEWRRRLAETDASAKAVAADVGVHPATIKAHVAPNDYDHDPEPTRDPVAFNAGRGWHYVEDST